MTTDEVDTSILGFLLWVHCRDAGMSAQRVGAAAASYVYLRARMDGYTKLDAAELSTDVRERVRELVTTVERAA